MTVNPKLFNKVFMSKHKLGLINLLIKFDLNEINDMEYNFDGKKFKIGKNKQKIIGMISTGETDKKIFNAIKPMIVLDKAYGSNMSRGIKKGKEILGLFNSLKCEKPKIIRYLDIGCNIGEITLGVKQVFKLDSANCIDVESFGGKQIVALGGIDHYIYDGINIPFENNTFEFITLLQVLHHVDKIDLFMKDLNRVVKKGGIIIVREHDCIDPDFAGLIDLEHLLWTVYDGMSYDDFVASRENTDAGYFNRKSLNEIFKKYGFSPCVGGSEYYRSFGPTNYFYTSFVKVNSVDSANKSISREKPPKKSPKKSSRKSSKKPLKKH